MGAKHCSVLFYLHNFGGEYHDSYFIGEDA